MLVFGENVKVLIQLRTLFHILRERYYTYWNKYIKRGIFGTKMDTNRYFAKISLERWLWLIVLNVYFDHNSWLIVLTKCSIWKFLLPVLTIHLTESLSSYWQFCLLVITKIHTNTDPKNLKWVNCIVFQLRQLLGQFVQFFQFCVFGKCKSYSTNQTIKQSSEIY